MAARGIPYAWRPRPDAPLEEWVIVPSPWTGGGTVGELRDRAAAAAGRPAAPARPFLPVLWTVAGEQSVDGILDWTAATHADQFWAPGQDVPANAMYVPSLARPSRRGKHGLTFVNAVPFLGEGCSTSTARPLARVLFTFPLRDEPFVADPGLAAGLATGAAAGAANAPALAVAGVQAIGFGAGGIAAGSTAASVMSATAVANGGGVAAGSAVAAMQSIGATGTLAYIGAAGTAAVLGVGAAAGTVLAAGGYFLYNRWRRASPNNSAPELPITAHVDQSPAPPTAPEVAAPTVGDDPDAAEPTVAPEPIVAD